VPRNDWAAPIGPDQDDRVYIQPPDRSRAPFQSAGIRSFASSEHGAKTAPRHVCRLCRVVHNQL